MNDDEREQRGRPDRGDGTSGAPGAGGRATPARVPPPRPRRALPASGDSTSPVDLDRVIHERLRLAIASALAVDDVLTFVELKGRLGTTDGNLSVHARKLEEAGYVACTRVFEGRMPRSEYRLTHAGRKALERYLDQMDAIIRTARRIPGTAPAPSGDGPESSAQPSAKPSPTPSPTAAEPVSMER